VDIAEELPTVIAFCAGYGGIERGLDLAGLEHRVIAYVEIEAFAIANLVNKMEAGQLPPAPIYTDLKTFPAHLFRDRVDLITGGYPCQPFSAAGQRLGTEDPRHLWPYILDHINAIRPVRCFFENVEGHISLGLREVIDDLEGAGYSATWGIFSAAEVGAPHQRKRVYIMANSISAGVWDNDRPPANEGRSAAQFGRADVRQGDREERSVRPESAGSSSADMGNSQNNRCAGCRETIKRERSENHIKRPDQDLRWQSQRSSQTLADSSNAGLQGAKGPRGAGTERQPNGHSAECGAELGDTKHYGLSAAEIRRDANPSGDNEQKGEIKAVEPERASQPNSGGDLSEPDQLADTESQHAGDVSKNIGPASREVNTPVNSGGSSRGDDKSRHGAAVAHPDQLADTICSRSETGIPGQERYNKERDARVSINCGGEHGRWQIGMPWPPEPRLGRVVDGCADRVDRIRLLGNAVVPQTAAKAWTTLVSREK
jgi:site-specific DNA-cytosine methylase